MYEKLPEQLKKDGRFCLWKYEERNGRMTKVPYQTNGRKASSADKNTFSDFRLAVNAMDGYDGIGMGAFDDFCMVDMEFLMTENFEKSIEYREKHKEGNQEFDNETKLEKIKKIWEKVITHRRLQISAGKIEVESVDGNSDKYNGNR